MHSPPVCLPEDMARIRCMKALSYLTLILIISALAIVASGWVSPKFSMAEMREGTVPQMSASTMNTAEQGGNGSSGVDEVQNFRLLSLERQANERAAILRELQDDAAWIKGGLAAFGGILLFLQIWQLNIVRKGSSR